MSDVDTAVQILTARGITAPVETAIVLGTGLGAIAEAVEGAVVVPYADLPGFPGGGVSGHGARLVVGGPDSGRSTGYFITPTVFSGVDNDMTIAREEIFGPVLSILPYRDEADAVRIANDTVYGLAAAVWSGDQDRALKVARQLQAGQVQVNGGAFNPAAPFGGIKESGLGREGGAVGIEEFLEVKYVGIAGPRPVQDG